MNYLHIDCEMGGRDLKYSLLTAYFMVSTESMFPLGELYLQIKPDDGDYILSGQGMAVNGINIQEHDKIAMPYKQAKPILYQFLQTHAQKERLIPVGHGVKGDINHILKNLISPGSWDQFCTYHYIDTSVVLQFMRACGKMPVDCDGSVGALANYFNIPINGTLHDAREDAKLTAAVLKALINLNNKLTGVC